MKNFTEMERKLLSDLLGMAADEFSNHGCNDYVLPNTPETREFLANIMKEDDEEWAAEILNRKGDKLYAQDWMLIRYFQKKVLENG
jgi:hypothetical protein